MITIIDYGIGNLGSILNMFKKAGKAAQISTSLSDVEGADKLLLPGVGSFDAGMANLVEKGLVDLLNYKVIDRKTPILGICLGMQLMTKSSEEGKLPGLGWVDAETVKFQFDPAKNLKIPHMGWNLVRPENENLLFRDSYPDSKFYFVHSYYVRCGNQKDVIGRTTYGDWFVSAFGHGNVYGTQFHPEKSHKYGLKLLSNFADFA